MYRHNYPDHPHPRSNSRTSGNDFPQDFDRPGSRNREYDQPPNVHGQDLVQHSHSHGQNFGHPNQGYGPNSGYPPHDYGQGHNRPPHPTGFQPRPQAPPQGFAPPLMSLQVVPDGDGPVWQNNHPFRGMTDNNPSSSTIRYRSRSPDHRLVDRSFSPNQTQRLLTTVQNPQLNPNTSQQLPDKVYECLGTVVLVQDFLECGVLQLKGADGRTANCLFFRKDVLVHARRERLSLETQQGVLFKANAWMMNRAWPVPYLAASVWLDGADIPPVIMAKIFQPPDSRTVELYQSLANDLAWQIPKEPVVRNPMFGPPEVAQRNVVLVDEENPPVVSPGRKVVLIDGVERPGSRRSNAMEVQSITLGRDMKDTSPMRQLRDSIRSSKQQERQKSWSPMGHFRDSLQSSRRLDVPAVDINLVSPVRLPQNSRSPRRRTRSRSQKRRHRRSKSPRISSRRSRSPRRRSRSPKKRSRSPRRRSRSPRRKSRSPRKRSRSHTRAMRRTRSKSAKRRRSRSTEKSRKPHSREQNKDSSSQKGDNKVLSKERPDRFHSQAIYSNGASAKVKSYLNEEIGILTVFPGSGSRVKSGEDVSNTQLVYFHIDQVWTKTSSIGLHQFREIYPTKDLKKKFPVDSKIWCNVRRIKTEEAEFQAIVVCGEGEYEEWKQRLNSAETFLQHSLEFNLSVIKYMETRKRECILNPFPSMSVVTVEAKVHEYFSLDVGFLKLCEGDSGVVLFHSNQVMVPASAHGKGWTRLKESSRRESKTMAEHLPLGMSVLVVVSQLPCHGCSQLRYQAQVVYKQSYSNLEDPAQDFKKRYSSIKEKLELKKLLDKQFDTFKRMTKLDNSSWSNSFSPVHAVLNGLPQDWQAVVVAVVNTEFGIIRLSRIHGEPLYTEQGMAPTMIHVLFHIDDVYDVHGFKATSSNMNMESLTDQYVDLTARTVCKRNKPVGIFDVQHKLAMENAAYVGIPLLQAIVVCVKMNATSAPVTRSVPKPTVLRKEPGNFDSEVSAYYLQYGLKVKLDLKLVQFIAVKNKPPLPYQKHMVSNYSFKEEKEVLEGLKCIDSEASQQLVYGKLNLKDIEVSHNTSLPHEISRIECTIKFLYRSNLRAEKGIVEIKPLVDMQTIKCLAYFQYSDLYKQQEQDFQCKDLAVLMPVSSKDKFCVSVQLCNPGYQVPYAVTVIWNETLRLKLAMPEPRPAPLSAETLSYREPLVKELIASCQDEIVVVDEAAKTIVADKTETTSFKKIKVPAKAGKAVPSLFDLYQDFIAMEADGSVVEYFESCEGTVEKVIGEHYLVVYLSETLDDKVKKIRVLATSTDIIASYDPESLDTITKVSNAKAAHTGINLYDLANPGDKVRLNAVLLAAEDSTIQYCATCVVIDPKRYMAKLVGPVDSAALIRPLPLPKFVPLLPEKTSKHFGNIWKETYQKIVSVLDGNLNIDSKKYGEALRILLNKAPPSKCTTMELRPCPKREGKETAVRASKEKSPREEKRRNLIYLTDSNNEGKPNEPSTSKTTAGHDSESLDKYDPFEAKKLYGRVIKILNPNYGIGVCQQVSDDGSVVTFQVLFDIFDVWIEDQVVAKMNKKLPDVMAVGDYLQMMCVKVEECINESKRIVEHMATAVAIAKSYKDVKTKRFPSAVVPIERIELIDDSKIDNFRKVVQILKGMEPDKNEKEIIEKFKNEMKNLHGFPKKLENKSKSHDAKKSDQDSMIVTKPQKSDAPSTKVKKKLESEKESQKLNVPNLIKSSGTAKPVSKSPDPSNAVVGLSFSKVAKDQSLDKLKSNSQTQKEVISMDKASAPVISIFTVNLLGNIEGSFWLGYTSSEKTIKRVIINTVLLEKTLFVEEGMILNCDISDVELEDPNDNNQVYHIAHSVKLNPKDEILLDDKRWKPKTKQTKYQPIVESVCNLELSKVQCCQLFGLDSVDLVINKELPNVLINQTGVIINLIDDSAAIIRLCVKEKNRNKTSHRYLHILADNAYRSSLDKEFYPVFTVGYPVTFHALKLQGNENKDVQYLATDICLHLDSRRFKDFVEVGNPVSIQSVLAFPRFKQVVEKLSLFNAATDMTEPYNTAYNAVVGHIKALNDEIILIQHSLNIGTTSFSKTMTLYMKTKAERASKTPPTLKEGQEVKVNYLKLSQDNICGLVTEMWNPQEEAKESKGFKGLHVAVVDSFKERVVKLMNPTKLEHLIPQNFLKIQSKYNKDDLQRLVTQYVEALEESVMLEGVKIAAPLSFQNIVLGANCEISLLDVKKFLILLGDICQESVGPKKDAYWDIALGKDLKIGGIVLTSSQTETIKLKGLTHVIKLLPRTRKNLLSWRYPEDWIKNAEKYSSFGIDASPLADCPSGWSRVDDSKLLAGALEHGLLFEDAKSEKLWSNFADDQGYGLGSKIFKEGILQTSVVKRLSYLIRVAEGRGRFCYDYCEDDDSLKICNIATVKEEVKTEVVEKVVGNSNLFNYDLNSTGSSTAEDAFVVIKEEYFEVDDALSLPTDQKLSKSESIDGALDQMDMMASLDSALEEMEKAAAVVEESYESELSDQKNLEDLEKIIFTPVERSLSMINHLSPSLSDPSEEVEYASSQTSTSALVMNGPSSHVPSEAHFVGLEESGPDDEDETVSEPVDVVLAEIGS